MTLVLERPVVPASAVVGTAIPPRNLRPLDDNGTRSGLRRISVSHAGAKPEGRRTQPPAIADPAISCFTFMRSFLSVFW